MIVIERWNGMMRLSRKPMIVAVALAVLVTAAGGRLYASQVDSPPANEKYSNSQFVHVSLQEISSEITRITFEFNDYDIESEEIDGGTYYRLLLPGEANLMKAGMPDIPNVTRSVIIPDDASVELHVVESDYDLMTLPVAPSRGHISRTLDRDDVPYEFSTIYQSDGFYPAAIARLGSPYIFRDYRGVAVSVFPFRYNPLSQTVRRYSRIVVELETNDVAKENVSSYRGRTASPYFQEIYRSHFLNFKPPLTQQSNEHGQLVVISYSEFMDAVQPYVEWKRSKGIPTELYDVLAIGSTPEDIRDFIASLYYSEDGLTFVQFVGDAEHVPTFLIDRQFCSGSATSDATYSLIDGTDTYPDIFVGRFSAATVADVQTQVDRTIYYEKELSDGEWLSRGTGLASVWGEGYGYLGMSDKQLVEQLRIMLLGYTYTQVDQLYEQGVPPAGIIPVPIADFVNALNDGRGIVLADGSGDCASSFIIPPGTYSAPYTMWDVFDLTNDYMLPFISIAAPYVGNFQLDMTYPEAWLRAVNTSTGAPVGAIAVYASSTDLDYASPQAAQYRMVELLVNNDYSTFGGLMYTGACYAMDLYGATGQKTFKSYSVLGDASLQVRTMNPEPMTVLHDPAIDADAAKFELNVAGTPDALCALSYDSVLVGSAVSDQDGYALIEFELPLGDAESVELVVTALNKKTYLAQIPVISYACGNSDGLGAVDIDDVVYLIAYIFAGGPAPDPLEAGDADCSGEIDIDDVVSLISYIFSAGPEPCDPDGNGAPDC
jgi:hypothetical protein